VNLQYRVPWVVGSFGLQGAAAALGPVTPLHGVRTGAHGPKQRISGHPKPGQECRLCGAAACHAETEGGSDHRAGGPSPGMEAGRGQTSRQGPF